MKRSVLALMCAASLPLAACTNYHDSSVASAAGTGAVLGAAGGAGVAAIAGGDLLAGAAIGAAVGGLAGAVWADRDNDGRADGYVYEGRYYEGAPAMTQAARTCKSTLGTAATGAAVGGVAGAALGAATGGLSILGGAVIGAAVGGVAGAIWADHDNDGCVDGYVREGQYYAGAPSQPVVEPVTYHRGERG